MKIYRLAKTKYIRDITGAGARIYGGRWNHKGTCLIYTSESRSLAVLEFLVHVPLAFTPNAMSIVYFEIPDSIVPKDLDPSALPESWKEYPAPLALADIGSEWAQSKKSLFLRVPSIIVEHEFNILINPEHPDIAFVSISSPERFNLDRRLIR